MIKREKSSKYVPGELVAFASPKYAYWWQGWPLRENGLLELKNIANCIFILLATHPKDDYSLLLTPRQLCWVNEMRLIKLCEKES